ncbi:unnamed protein product, partial [Schistosoma curassoni]|uniref:Na_H_Exchanger domain-containing protein n=1 Tax=Schistosoma curassoni TaxID=6186 RepID=A0A183L181_9TREM
ILGIICIALAGRGYHEIGFQYLIGIGTFSAIGNIVFLLMYGFATTRPLDGRSILKLIMLVGGSQQETLDPGFVLLGTLQ